MLSGETAKGKYPLAAVEVMNKIAKKVDATIPPFYVEGVINKHDITTAVAEGSADISERLNAKLIVVGTESGRAARDMRRYFPKANILAITNNEKNCKSISFIKRNNSICRCFTKNIRRILCHSRSCCKKIKFSWK